MSAATVDPTLEALVPRGSARRNAALVAAYLVLLVGLWYLPPLLRPGLDTSPGGSWREFADERRVVLLAGVTPHGWGGVEVRSVGDVPGAHVVGAWLVDGELSGGYHGRTDTPGQLPPGTSALDYATGLPGVGDDTRLPRAVPAGADGTLVVLWQIDDCAALNGRSPQIESAARWGAVRLDDLRYSPFQSYAGSGGEIDGACTP